MPGYCDPWPVNRKTKVVVVRLDCSLIIALTSQIVLLKNKKFDKGLFGYASGHWPIVAMI